MLTPNPSERAAHASRLLRPTPSVSTTASAAAASPRRRAELRARVPLPVMDPPPLASEPRSPPLAAARSCVPLLALELHPAPPRLPPLTEEPRHRGHLPLAWSHPAAAASPPRRAAQPRPLRSTVRSCVPTPAVEPPPLTMEPPCRRAAGGVAAASSMLWSHLPSPRPLTTAEPHPLARSVQLAGKEVHVDVIRTKKSTE
ncbi:hypothetical protein BS78_04G197300 [Paspalum vaginatum]|nr:hypothetical protein BS78_04G197300 [Paspalum vaginatum]